MAYTFLDCFVDKILKPKNLDVEKARKWFTGEMEFVIDIYARDICSEELSSYFFREFDFNEKMVVFANKIKKHPEYENGLKQLFKQFCTKTLYGVTKYCLESDDWEDKVVGDDVYRYEWFHFVIANVVDRGLMSALNPKLRQVMLLLSIPPQHGKFREATLPVLTTTGWKPHGELEVGDYVFNAQGKAVKVLANSGIYEWDVVDMHLVGGEVEVSAPEHLWEIWYQKGGSKIRRKAVLETQEIFKINHRRKPYIECTKALQLPYKEVPIEPYALGVYLAGGTRRVKITKSQKVLKTLDYLHGLEFSEKYNKKSGLDVHTITYSMVSQTALEQLGISDTKRIPETYFTAKEEQRWALLQGIADTSCFIDAEGACAVRQKSKDFAEDLQILLRTLGIKARCRYDKKKDLYSVDFSPYRQDPVFRDQKKRLALLNKKTFDCTTKKKHFIKSVGTETRKALGNCIQVEGGIYLAGKGLVPTHNSFLISGMLPAYFMGNKPRANGLLISYNEDMAKLIMDRDFAPMIATKGYSKLFGSLFACNMSEVVKKSWQAEGRKLPKDKEEVKGTIRGGLFSVGSLSQATGKRADFLVLDDPIRDFKDAISQAFLDTTNANVETSLNTRMNSRTFACIVQTRWAKNDPLGKAIERVESIKAVGVDMGLYNICLRAFNEVDDFPYDFRTQKGEMLWENFHALTYANAKVSALPMVYNALYQQRPIDGAGAVFVKSWINMYSTLTFNVIDNETADVEEGFEYLGEKVKMLPKMFTKLAISLDTSYNEKVTSDKCAVGVFGITKCQKYVLLDVTYDRMNFPKTLEVVKKYIKKYPNYTEILVEAKALGQSVIDTLKSQMSRVITIDVTESKKARAFSVQPIVMSGNLYLPETKEGQEVLHQMCAFTGEGSKEKDDLVDMVTQTLRYYDANFLGVLRSSDIGITPLNKQKTDYTLSSKNKFEIYNSFSSKSKTILDKFKGGQKWL